MWADVFALLFSLLVVACAVPLAAAYAFRLGQDFASDELVYVCEHDGQYCPTWERDTVDELARLRPI